MASRQGTGGVAAVDRATDVLSLFADSGNSSLGVTEIAEELGLSKAVVHRMLASLKANGFVEADGETRRYRLGTKILHLGLAYLERLQIRDLARPVLEELSRSTEESATLSIRTGYNRVYIDQVTPARDIRMIVPLGRPFPLHAGASSKALLAFLDSAEIDAYLNSTTLAKLTRSTSTNPRSIRKEIATIREQGFATSVGERMAGAASVAAPVFAHDGRPEAAISVCGPQDRFLPVRPKAAALLVEATAGLSARLGHRT